VEHNDDGLRINLLLNRNSPWADINSFVPYEGRVEIKAKVRLKSLAVRIPAYAGPTGGVVCSVDEVPMAPTFDGRCLLLNEIPSGASVTVTFPLPEQTLERHLHADLQPMMMGAAAYDRLVFRGSTLISIDPPGRNYPYYQREYFREPVRWHRVRRFLSGNAVQW
jgi:hypothetical protein